MRTSSDIQNKVDQLVLLDAQERLCYLESLGKDNYRAEKHLQHSIRYRMLIDALRWTQNDPKPCNPVTCDPPFRGL